ncbi:acyloxyacyl hydrolase [Nitratifractor salsuginis]|uniref:Lipid A 3-O-deacylase-related protein n=1 Tax=Nitratifractor salsuginis (strain DSM 16511 / JCM 12458 / E9I37-1) TaxID=749222 RepID=E6WY10_NITSE|nr:acyloxyacyl hydrolase [Nitratifractor salsuginis]ADV46384.1 Lipid A 3-O-deacylase-related protein [Nitratifractor salsuginis DSM 16511]
MNKILRNTIAAVILPAAIWAGGDLAPAPAAQSSDWIDGIGISYGQSKDNIDIYRLYLRKDFQSRWFQSDLGYLSGYWEGSLNYWDGYGTHNYGVALSPVFTYLFNTSGTFTPYLEGGIGVSWFSKTQMGPRDLSTHFLFEDRIGAGVRIGNWDLSFRYMHYSNAGIKKPNDGIDIFIGSLSYRF